MKVRVGGGSDGQGGVEESVHHLLFTIKYSPDSVHETRDPFRRSEEILSMYPVNKEETFEFETVVIEKGCRMYPSHLGDNSVVLLILLQERSGY